MNFETKVRGREGKRKAERSDRQARKRENIDK
jgi:hypothetical protein